MATQLCETAERPIVWTIAGSDSGGGAGIQADLPTMQDLGCHACSVISTLTAQSSVAVNLVEPVSDAMLLAQLNILLGDLPPRAIKIGLLASQAQIDKLCRWLADELACYCRENDVEVPVVLDPVMVASCGDGLQAKSQLDFSPFSGLVALLTPNVAELGRLAGNTLECFEDFQRGAKALAAQFNCQILAKGGDAAGLWRPDTAVDLLVIGQEAGISPLHCHACFSLASPRLDTQDTHGSGCTLSAAIVSFLAHGYVLPDAVVLAKAYVNSGLHQGYGPGVGPGLLGRTGWPEALERFPVIADLRPGRRLPEGLRFKSIDERLGLYPVVDDVTQLGDLLVAGAKTVQLRLKRGEDDELRRQISACVSLGRDFGARVFINDHWRLALELGAYGVHLGQEDLLDADLPAIAGAGLALGISSHGYFELLLAHQLSPSYLALGHIFATTTKQMPSAPQGLIKLGHYVDLLSGHYPLVAIGGIDISRLRAVRATGVDDVALVRAISRADDPGAAYRQLQQVWEQADE